jgi:hypothetical protein
MVNRTRSATRLTTQNSIAAHMIPVIRVYDDAGNVIEAREHKGDFKEP